VALHGVSKEQVARGDWLVAPGSLKASKIMDARFELLPDYPREWKAATRVRFHLGASETIGRLVLLEGTSLRAGGSALAQVLLEKPAVSARGDRFVIRSYSPSRTVGGGTIIEPVAVKRRRRAAGLESLAVHETGSLDARLLERLASETRPVVTAILAQALGEKEAEVGAAMTRLVAGAQAVAPAAGRWLSVARWSAAREAIAREVAAYCTRLPARYGIPKGELKSGLKSSLEASLFDAAFDALVAESALAVRGERVRPAGSPWQPPADVMAALEHLEVELESGGLAVPETAAWQKKLGATGAEVLSLGYFLDRLVRVSQEFTYTAKQLEGLRAKLAAHFAKKPTMNVAEFKEISGVSRKYAVPLLEHGDRVGWTARSGDERKAGGRLG
jgi:selenocysteine-specific elongation factor